MRCIFFSLIGLVLLLMTSCWGISKEYTYNFKDKVLIDYLYDGITLLLEIQPQVNYMDGKNYIAKGPYHLKVAFSGSALEQQVDEVIFKNIILKIENIEQDIRGQTIKIHTLSRYGKYDFTISELNDFRDSGILVFNNDIVSDTLIMRFGDFDIDYDKVKKIHIKFDIDIKANNDIHHIERMYTFKRVKDVKLMIPSA